MTLACGGGTTTAPATPAPSPIAPAPTPTTAEIAPTVASITSAIAASTTHPDWSPDGSKIAFVSTRDGNEEIYVMRADGSGPTRLHNAMKYPF